MRSPKRPTRPPPAEGGLDQWISQHCHQKSTPGASTPARAPARCWPPRRPGQDTPAIAAPGAQYAQMWAQDAAAMYGYADSSAAASTLTPFADPAPTTSAEADTLTQATTSNAGVQSMLSQLMSGVPTALQ